MSTPDGLEAQLSQLQTTLSQLWLRMRQDDPPPDDVVVLGTVYPNSSVTSPAVAAAVAARVWCTYRSGFEPIERSPDGPGPLTFVRLVLLSGSAGALFSPHAFTSDVGWGCMIRTLQLLLANALLALGGAEGRADNLLLLFGDTYDCPFSLHNFIRAASELPLQVKPGEWFGPSAASLSIKRLCARAGEPRLRVHVSESGDLYGDEMAALFARAEPVLVLFPIRLGIDRVNAIYYPSLFQLLAVRQAVGIAGGKPLSLYYFFGYLGADLLYLDPHNVQPVSGSPDTYHTPRCSTLPIASLDPSMLVGVLLHDAADYADFQHTLTAAHSKIVHFHEHSRRRRSVTGEDYVKVSAAEFDAAAADDFVDLGDDFSDASVDADASVGSLAKYDIVECPASEEEPQADLLAIH